MQAIQLRDKQNLPAIVFEFTRERCCMGILRRTFATHAPCSTVLIRIMVGGMFLADGIQNSRFVEDLGMGRYGIPYPEFMTPFVGLCEVICVRSLSSVC